MSEITYTKVGDYLYPNIVLNQPENVEIGKYGRMRWRYLKEHRRVLFTNLLLTNKLTEHLLEVEQAAQNRLDLLMPQLAKEAGATETLKATDPMKWVGLMNTCKAQVEEIIKEDLIYS